MNWMFLLIGVGVVLGLRDRTARGSTHVTILVVTCATLAYVFVFQLGR